MFINIQSKPIGRPSRSSSNTNLASLANDLTVDTRRVGGGDKILKEKSSRERLEKQTVCESNQAQSMPIESIKKEKNISIPTVDASNSFSTLLIQAHPVKIESTCLNDAVVKAGPIDEPIATVNTEIAVMTTASASMEVDTKSHKVNEEPIEIELKKRKLKGSFHL